MKRYDLLIDKQDRSLYVGPCELGAYVLYKDYQEAISKARAEESGRRAKVITSWSAYSSDEASSDEG